MDEKNLQEFVVELDEARRDLAYEGTWRLIDLFDEQKEARTSLSCKLAAAVEELYKSLKTASSRTMLYVFVSR